MFEAAEVGHRIDKETYREQEPKIRADLLEMQKRLAGANLSVIVIVGGVEGAGKEETVDLLMAWLDSRGIEVHAAWDTTDEERERPYMWRFWRNIPPKGKIAVMFGSWYTGPVVERTYGRIEEAPFEIELQKIVDFERMLSHENVVLIKLWMHLAKDVQEKQLKKLRKDPETSWKVTPQTWKYFKKYDAFVKAAEEAIRYTSTAFAPWKIVEAANWRYQSLTVMEHLHARITYALDHQKPPPRPVPNRPHPEEYNLIQQLDLSVKLSDAQYKRQHSRLRAELAGLTRKLREEGRSMLLTFEGPDAAGKGGAIRRLIEPIDARNYQVISIAAPTDEEQARPYLWRFWRYIPRKGRVIIFDRSWYGRVLVERIEGFATREEWTRAYSEINSFEKDLTDYGIILVKFWLAISPEEQLQRFRDREVTPFKQYKLTEEDWRNREKWDAYEAAACKAIQRTGTTKAPWVLVEANDKNWARMKVMKTVVKTLRHELT